MISQVDTAQTHEGGHTDEGDCVPEAQLYQPPPYTQWMRLIKSDSELEQRALKSLPPPSISNLSSFHPQSYGL